MKPKPQHISTSDIVESGGTVGNGGCRFCRASVVPFRSLDEVSGGRTYTPEFNNSSRHTSSCTSVCTYIYIHKEKESVQYYLVYLYSYYS